MNDGMYGMMGAGGMGGAGGMSGLDPSMLMALFNQLVGQFNASDWQGGSFANDFNPMGTGGASPTPPAPPGGGLAQPSQSPMAMGMPPQNKLAMMMDMNKIGQRYPQKPPLAGNPYA
jgi:hypothetical protein